MQLKGLKIRVIRWPPHRRLRISLSASRLRLACWPPHRRLRITRAECEAAGVELAAAQAA